MWKIQSPRLPFLPAFVILAVFLILAGCASNPSNIKPKPHYKVGTPYQVKGTWYYPAEDPDYDKVGVASWYGRDFHGRYTANGEVYDMNAMTAAHPTLPMPSFVEVENLQNQRRVVVRVNDRGPFAKNRIIDMSRAAAKRLGFTTQGTTEVRVRYLAPAPLPGEEGRVKVAARQSRPDRELMMDPVEPKPMKADIPTAVAARPSIKPAVEALYAIRIAALSSLANITKVETALSSIGPLRISRIKKPQGPLYRINMGPLCRP